MDRKLKKKPPCAYHGKHYVKYVRLGKQFCRRKPVYDYTNINQTSMKNIQNKLNEIKKSINEFKNLNLYKKQNIKSIPQPPPLPRPPKLPLSKKPKINKNKPKINIQTAMIKELKNKLAKRKKAN
jgi:hypothetical protein